MLQQIETEIGPIATDWSLVKLKDIADKPQYGFTASASKSGNVKFLRITDITDLGVDWESVPLCECPEDRLSTYLLKSGDIVFARIGATTGKSYLLDNPPNAIFASYLIRVRANSEVVPEYLIHFFQSSGYWKQINANKHNNLKKGVNGSVLQSLLVPKPPLNEQKKIAYVLSTVQRAIAQQEKIIQTTTELKKALMHKLFTEGLHGEKQKETEIGLIPESWKVLQLSKMIQIKHGYAFKGEFFKPEGEFILMTPGHFNEDGGFRDQKDKTKYYVGEIPSDYLLKSGDLLIAMTEQKAGLLGSPAFVPEANKYLHNQRLGLVESIDDLMLNKKFLFHTLNTLRVRNEIAKTATGSKVKHTSPNKIRDVLVGVPSLDEQVKIANCLDTAFKKIDLAEAKKKTLSDLFRVLLHQLMTAQIRVHDIDLPGFDENLEPDLQLTPET